MNIPVVYEDDWLLIANKPSGLLTIPTPKKETRTLTSILNEDSVQRGFLYRLHPCHRLDKDTSGLIIYAKGKSAQQKMMALFKESKIKKTYLAFVSGHLEKTHGVIASPIEGQEAASEYRVIVRKQGFVVVEVRPLTGRTNQIRIHFLALGHPVLGETKFAFRRDFAIKAKRLCLHAKALEFMHPFTDQRLHVEAELPPELKEFLRSH